MLVLIYKNKLPLFFFIILFILCANCAKRGTITGGKKDEIPPKFIKALPPNRNLNFDKKQLKIYFDEYVLLKDPQKQIIFSPPMDPPPTIKPAGGISKKITIQFLDSLLPNTTYSINFGKSITDNNEGNVLPNFNYVFSTGKALDSLSLSGKITDAWLNKPENNVTVALYEINKQYSDSLVYKEVPRYITNTLQGTSFKLGNLRKGTYKLIALLDKVSNNTYQPKQDKIGFYPKEIRLPRDVDSIFSLALFKEEVPFRLFKPTQISPNKILFGYEGNRAGLQIRVLDPKPNQFVSKILPERNKDSIYFWFKSQTKLDSIRFVASIKDRYRDTLQINLRKLYKDSLKLNILPSQTLSFGDTLYIVSKTPIALIDASKMQLTDTDSIAVPFRVDLKTNADRAALYFDKAEQKEYTLRLFPKALVDFVGNTNDSLQFPFETLKHSDYGQLYLTIKCDPARYPILAELADEKGKRIQSKLVTEEEELLFEDLQPGKYNIRAIVDRNKNGKWDTGNFMKQMLPEEVIYYPESIDVRANWELKQTFVLDQE